MSNYKLDYMARPFVHPQKLSLKELEEIARKTGLVDNDGNIVFCTDKIATCFDKECEKELNRKQNLATVHWMATARHN